MTAAAAFNINGETLHSVCKLPVHNFPMPRQTLYLITICNMVIARKNYVLPLSSMHGNLSNASVSAVRSRFLDVDVLIIDEYAMMGKYTLWRIDNTFRRAFDINLPFGGKSVILLGDPH